VARQPDHFSTQSAGYKAHRPGYPTALFDYLAAATHGRKLAWDCGCGSGQATLPLAERFGKVVATDLSPRQVASAEPRPNVCYVAASAHAPPLADGSCDLVAVAQALHWFAGDSFYAQVRRVLRRGGVVAAWSYDLLEVSAAVDAIIGRLYRDLGRWWPPERRHVEERYANLPFPFEQLPAPPFSMSAHWDYTRLIGYLRTWSATAACRRETGHDPVAAVADELARAWGNPATPLEVRWVLTLRVGRI